MQIELLTCDDHVNEEGGRATISGRAGNLDSRRSLEQTVLRRSAGLHEDIGLLANGISGSARYGEPLHDRVDRTASSRPASALACGESPLAESYLERWPVLLESDDALDLVYAEVLLRRERGESPSLAEYQERFPRFAEALRLHFELEPWMADEPAQNSLMEHAGRARAACRHGGAATAPAAPMVPGYEIEGELGRGGMGVVYKARQVRLNRVCALKMILAGAHADPEAFLRFLGEAESVARLNHPNIIQIHHTGEVDGLPFLELEYVDGESLAAALNGTPWAPGGRPSWSRSWPERWPRRIARESSTAILSRPTFLLAGDGTPKITDFGLAKALGYRLGADADQFGHRFAELHGTRASRRARQGRRTDDGHLLAGRDPLRTADRPAAVQGRERGGDDGAGAHARSGRAGATGAGPAARRGNDLPDMPSKRAVTTICARPRRWPTTWSGSSAVKSSARDAAPISNAVGGGRGEPGGRRASGSALPHAWPRASPGRLLLWRRAEARGPQGHAPGLVRDEPRAVPHKYRRRTWRSTEASLLPTTAIPIVHSTGSLGRADRAGFRARSDPALPAPTSRASAPGCRS